MDQSTLVKQYLHVVVPALEKMGVLLCESKDAVHSHYLLPNGKIIKLFVGVKGFSVSCVESVNCVSEE